MAVLSIWMVVQNIDRGWRGKVIVSHSHGRVLDGLVMMGMGGMKVLLGMDVLLGMKVWLGMDVLLGMNVWLGMVV